ncbi:MAG: hypothetical protein IPG97_11000 [Microthrixaceae bacterium]|nr:hypothetical protein [Microthrixaceae bacterium]
MLGEGLVPTAHAVEEQGGPWFAEPVGDGGGVGFGCGLEGADVSGEVERVFADVGDRACGVRDHVVAEVPVVHVGQVTSRNVIEQAVGGGVERAPGGVPEPVEELVELASRRPTDRR